jgi:hypothetical protein
LTVFEAGFACCVVWNLFGGQEAIGVSVHYLNIGLDNRHDSVIVFAVNRHLTQKYFGLPLGSQVV